MGTKQLLLIVLGTILAALAISVGISLFQSQADSSNRDAVIVDLNNICDKAYTYFISSSDQGGGGRSFKNYKIPDALKSNANGTYVIQTAGNSTRIRFRGRGVEKGLNPRKQAGMVAYRLEINSSGKRTLVKLN